MCINALQVHPKDHRRYANLVEADEARGVAQLELLRACGRIKDHSTAAAYLKRCIKGALAHWLRDRALMVRLPKNARGEAPWTHQSLDQVRPERGGSWLGGLAAPDSRSPETEKARDVGLEAMVDQLPTERWTGFSGQPPSLTSEVGHRP
ncbi:hypothetical protein [Synechococcus sp. MW101C3]|uniref:hypothetical protein n=1 Tax=Synechococcus sp. MW101C3 TaxID=210768 RepID=UPI000B99D003|nr:hypothetical protein [Synechococcus sp. MW101C3]